MTAGTEGSSPLAYSLDDPFVEFGVARRAVLEDLGHLQGQGLELLGVRRRVGQADVRIGRGRLRIVGHADLVVVQVVDAVEDLDLPLAGRLDLLPQVEGRLGGVEADGRLDQGLAKAGRLPRLGAPDLLQAVGRLADRDEDLAAGSSAARARSTSTRT